MRVVELFQLELSLADVRSKLYDGLFGLRSAFFRPLHGLLQNDIKFSVVIFLQIALVCV